ncbi:MAG: HAMP domain-containing sensor histidine kinase [Proteobacteria bacterium]|nr:HAMP domain-containing sensor histidine kinase [Pseudomonadota bacterium]
MTVIDGRARQLQAVIAQPPQTTEKAKKYADDIMRVNRRTDDLVGSITRFSQPTLLDRRKSTAISDLVSEAQLIIQPKLATSMVTLTLLIAEPDIAVHCSDVEISQVLINLLGNSADAIQTMEPEQRWIRLEVNSDQGMVKFTITDSGPGISQDDLKKMSKVFFTTKEQGKGTGQGLAYCKSIIARHQGRFAYDNESVNTRFVFWLPAAEKSSDAAAA